jgi:hypothetical protein
MARLGKSKRSESRSEMANTTRMSKSAKSALPYAQRLIGDKDAQAQLRTAYTKLREAYGRAAGKPARKAAEDKKLQRSLGEAAESIRSAVGSLQQPPRKRRRRRGARVLVLALLAGGAVLAAKQASS